MRGREEHNEKRVKRERREKRTKMPLIAKRI